MGFDQAMLLEPFSLPLAVTIYGEPKVGKTELECSFSKMDMAKPNMILMLWENPGPTLRDRKDIRTTPVFNKFEQAIEFLRWLYGNPGDFTGLGIDGITSMSRAFEEEIIKNHKAEGMGDAAGGWGKAYGILASMHQKIVTACEALRKDRGFEIVYVAHSDIKSFKQPDGESYNFYGIDMHEDSAKLYINNSDIIGYVDQKSMTRKSDDKRTVVVDSDRRYIRVKYSAAYVSGNRFGIVDDIVFEKGKNPLEQYRGKE